MQSPYIRFWFAAFLLTAGAAALIQLVILPYFLPHLHAGHGLLVGGDWIAFHQTAAALAERIRAEGWSAWTLRPWGGNAPPGLASAVYAVTVTEPYVLIPFNAALHATAGLAIALIIEHVVGERRIGFVAALPFLAFPTAALMYAQMHKDGFVIAGVLLFLLGQVQMYEAMQQRLRLHHLCQGVTLCLLGSFLAWIMRPYTVQILQPVAWLAALIAVGLLFQALVSKERARLRRTAIGFCLIAAVPFAMTPLKTIDEVSTAWNQVGNELTWNSWQYTLGVPEQIERALFTIARIRETGFGPGGSYIDEDYRPRRVADFVEHVPRTMLVGVLAPFPVHWLGDGSTNAGTAMRRMVGMEMLVVYLILICLPFAIVALRRKPLFWVLVGFSLAMLWLYASVIPNLGTLHRLRYGYLMTLVALVSGGALHYFSDRRRHALAEAAKPS